MFEPYSAEHNVMDVRKSGETNLNYVQIYRQSVGTGNEDPTLEPW